MLLRPKVTSGRFLFSSSLLWLTAIPVDRRKAAEEQFVDLLDEMYASL